MEKSVGISLSLLLSVTLLYSQPLRKAQKNMALFEYAKAISILSKAVENPKERSQAIPLLADCYRLQNDAYNARTWYGKAITLPNPESKWFLYYANSLRTLGEYDKAKEIFQKYLKMNPGDTLAARYSSYCDSVLGPWARIPRTFEIKNVHSINTMQSDFGPSFYEGDLVFSSDRMKVNAERRTYGWTGRGYVSIYKSKPNSPGEFWGTMGSPVKFGNAINQKYHDGPIVFTADGRTAFFTRTYHDKAKKINKIKTNMLKIFLTTKHDGQWSEPKPFFLNSPDYSVGHPAISSDGSKLYFVSDRPDGFGGTDIWECSKENDKWGSPVNLGKTINTPCQEMFPTLINDTILFFSSDGLPGYGGLDLFVSFLRKGVWSKPLNLYSPINSSFDDFALALAPSSSSEEGHWTGFFSSNRRGGVGSDDIYAFKGLRPEVPKPEAKTPLLTATEKHPGICYLQGYVKDKTTLKPIEGATVFLLNAQNGKIKVLKTNPEGLYKAPVETPGKILPKAMRTGFIADCMIWPLDSLKPDQTINAPRDLLLDKLEMNKIFKIENIYYDFDKYNIRADARPELDKLVRIMQENPINVELGSHTDCRGSFKYNEWLSQMRAESAVGYIVQSGISSYRITAKGYGEYKLVNKCADGVPCTEAEHQMNRRTEFKVTGYTDVTKVEDLFDPDLFKEGDIINDSFLPSGFFSICFGQKKAEQKPIPSKDQKPDMTLEKPLVKKPVNSIVEKPVVNKAVGEKSLSSGNNRGQVLYTVQIASGFLDQNITRNLPGLMYHTGTDKVTRYYIGQFNNRDEAVNLRSEMIQKGFTDAWISIMDNNRPNK